MNSIVHKPLFVVSVNNNSIVIEIISLKCKKKKIFGAVDGSCNWTVLQLFSLCSKLVNKTD